ncbi:MAG: hypothetical protein GC200_02420 [Tepidisphaera sp.]|nr:hypothetical protein [Tepidisphaera sp.]
MTPPTRLMREDMLGVAALVVVSVGAYLGGIEPVREAQAKAAEQRDTLTKLKGEVGEREQQLVALRTLLEKVRGDAKHSIALSGPGLLAQRLTEIPAVATRQGVKVAEIQPSAAVALDGLSKQPIRFSGEGGYLDVVKFLDTLDAELPDVEVTALSIFSLSNADRPTARFSADVSWYTLPAGSAAPAAKPAQTAAPVHLPDDAH